MRPFEWQSLSDDLQLTLSREALRHAAETLAGHAEMLAVEMEAGTLLDPVAMQPLLHVSQRFPASRLCAAPVIPLARHPQIDSQVIVFDLGDEPEALLDRHAFMPQQPAFDRQRIASDRAGVTTQALPAYHPMTGNQDRDGIAPASTTNGSGGGVESLRQLAVGQNGAHWNSL